VAENTMRRPRMLNTTLQGLRTMLSSSALPILLLIREALWINCSRQERTFLTANFQPSTHLQIGKNSRPGTARSPTMQPRLLVWLMTTQKSWVVAKAVTPPGCKRLTSSRPMPAMKGAVVLLQVFVMRWYRKRNRASATIRYWGECTDRLHYLVVSIPQLAVASQ